METIRLGRTGLNVTRTSFGALPIQRIDFDAAGEILRAAVGAGLNFIDTARAYSDSEDKIGYALAHRRDDFLLATKAHAQDRGGVLESIETSLTKLKTDHIDILQLHNPSPLPDPDDADSSYAGCVEAKAAGKIRFIGLTAHRLDNALAAAESGLYDTVQFPISAISTPEELKLIEVCKTHDVGLIAMKALCGGLLANIPAAFAFFRQYDNVAPIWGIQRMSELVEFIELEADPPQLDAEMMAAIEADRAELGGDFCRGCGYCLPCPADIPIHMAARMAFLLRRAPAAGFLAEPWRQKMARIDNCTECGQCRDRCPYDLDTPALLKRMYADYKTFIAETP